jgi:hypothetical protein
MKAFLAEGMALTGDLDNALRLTDEITAQIERPGWEERMSYAEVLCLRGWMLSLKGDVEGAERNFLASLDWARRQQAKMWELRHVGQPGTTVAEPGPAPRGISVARPGLWLVHRRLRHQGFDGGEGSAGRAGMNDRQTQAPATAMLVRRWRRLCTIGMACLPTLPRCSTG